MIRTRRSFSRMRRKFPRTSEAKSHSQICVEQLTVFIQLFMANCARPMPLGMSRRIRRWCSRWTHVAWGCVDWRSKSSDRCVPQCLVVRYLLPLAVRKGLPQGERDALEGPTEALQRRFGSECVEFDQQNHVNLRRTSFAYWPN